MDIVSNGGKKRIIREFPPISKLKLNQAIYKHVARLTLVGDAKVAMERLRQTLIKLKTVVFSLGWKEPTPRR